MRNGRMSDRFSNYRELIAKRAGEACGERRHEVLPGDVIGWHAGLRKACCAECWARWCAENAEADRAESYGGGVW